MLPVEDFLNMFPIILLFLLLMLLLLESDTFVEFVMDAVSDISVAVSLVDPTSNDCLCCCCCSCCS